jgi:TP901 family phage tail tape measure protein
MAEGEKLDTLFYELEAKTAKFDEQIAAARKSLRDLTGQRDTKVPVDADTAPLTAKVRQAKKQVEEIGGGSGSKATVKIDANITALEAQLADAKRLAAELGATRNGKPLVAKLDAQISAFETKIARAKAQMVDLSSRPQSVKLDAQISGFQSGLKKLSVDLTAFAEQAGAKLNVTGPVDESTSAVEAFAENFTVAGRSIGGSAEQITSALANPYNAVAALATAIVGLGVASTGVAASFDTSFRKVQAALPTSTETGGLTALRREIVDLTQITPRTAEELNKVAAAVAKMGTSDTAEVANNLRTLALVGDAISAEDLGPLADQLDLIGDAFGMTAQGAREAFVQIAAMAKGKIALEDLSGVLGKSATRMSALGVSAQEAAAAMVVLVDAGINSRQITTGLVDLLDRAGTAERTALEAAAAGKEDEAEALRTFASTVNLTNVSSRGLVGTLGDLFIAFDGSRAKFQAAGLGLNDFQIAAKAAEASAGGATTQVLSYADSLDKLSPAAEVNRQSAAALAQILKNELSAQLIDLGNVFLPTVNRGLQLLVDLLSDVRRQAKQTSADLPAIRELVDRGRTGFAVRRAQPTIAAINNTPGFLDGFDVAKLRDLQGIFRALQNAGESSEGLNKALATVETRLASLTQGAATVSAAMDDPKKAFEDNARAASAAAEKLAAAAEAYERLRETLSGMSEAERAVRAIDDFAAAQRKAGVGADLLATRVATLKADMARTNADKAAKEVRDFAAALDENAIALAAMMKAEADRMAQSQQARKDTRDEITLIRLRSEVTRTGSEESRRALADAEKALVVEKARAVAAKENGANPTSIALAGNLAAQLFDARQNAVELQEAVRQLGEGDVAGRLAGVAAQFTQIALSMGQAGKSIAQVAGVLGPLLSGVSGLGGALKRVATNADGSVRRDSAGKAVTETLGFFDTIKGKNGVDRQAKAIAASVSIVGTAFQVADALDLFGTRAKARAKELAEAARQFNSALQDFAAKANPQSGASEAIRQLQREAAGLLKQGIESRGGSFTGAAPTSVSAAELRSEAAAITALMASITGRAGAELRKLLGGMADDMIRVADALDANEAAARKVVLANIEDLGVRKLMAAGLTTQANALRERLAADRALETALGDTTEEGKRFYEALKVIQQAEAAAAAEMTRRAQIQQRLTDDNALLGGTTTEKLQRTVTAFGASFSQFAGIFGEFDLSTRAGLEQARNTIRGIYETLAADGIDDLERPIVEWLKTLYGEVDAALSALPEVLDPIATALEAFSERVKLFGLSFADQLTGLVAIIGPKLGEFFGAAIAGIEIGTAEGKAELKAILEAQLRGILSDGVITEAERPLFEWLTTILGVVTGAIEKAAEDADAAAQAVLARLEEQEQIRQATLRRLTGDFQVTSALFDLSQANEFVIGLERFGVQFNRLLGVVDVSSIAGITAARENLKQMRADLLALSDADILARYGLTRDELLSAITDVAGGLDSLGDALQSLAAQQNDFITQLSLDLAESFGTGLDVITLQSQTWVAQMIATAEALFPVGAYLDGLIASIRRIGQDRIDDFVRDNPTTVTPTGPLRDQDIAAIRALDGLSEAGEVLVTIARYGGEFAAAMGEINLNSLSGVEQARGRLRAMRQDLLALSDQEIATKYGLTKDQLLEAITAIGTGLNTLGGSLRTLADQQRDFLTDINLAYFDAFGMGLEAVQLQTEIWVAQMIATATALNLLTPDLEGRIRKIGDQRITNFQNQQSGSAGGAAGAPIDPKVAELELANGILQGMLLNGVRTGQLANPDPLPEPTSGPTARDEFVASDVTGISSTEALRMTDYLSLMLLEERRTAAGVEALQSIFAAVLSTTVPSLEVPSLPRGMGGFGSGALSAGGFTAIVNIYGASGAPEQAGRAAAEALVPFLDEYLARAAGVQARNAGIPFLS